jgi:LemA protein
LLTKLIKGKMKKLRIGLLAAVVAVLFSSCGYNKMVSMDEKVTSQWAQVENVYQRRADLIPNLVNTVKGYAAHEQETLEGVIEARSKATSVNIDPTKLTPETMQQFNQAQEGLSSALSRLMVVVERYPELKANQNFLDLQAQLEGTENRITVERMKFNETTQTYNAYIRKFPQVIYSGWFGFDKKTYFEAQQGADKAPEVQF